MANYWLVKSEPETYSWDDFVKKGRDHWDGVRNFAARKHMTGMKLDDTVLFYHSGDEKAVVGMARVVKEAYPDPTTDDDRWVVVDLVPLEKFAKPVTLKEIKADDRLADLSLVRIPRLSVQPLSEEAYNIILGKSANG